MWKLLLRGLKITFRFWKAQNDLQNCRARDRNNTDWKKLCKSLIYSSLPTWNSLSSPEGCRYNCLKAFMKQFSPFCSQSPWQAVTMIFSGGPVAALPNYFLKSVKIFLPDSQCKRWRSDFQFDVPLQSKEKNWLHEVDTKQSTNVCAVGQNGLSPSSTYKKKRN